MLILKLSTEIFNKEYLDGYFLIIFNLLPNNNGTKPIPNGTLGISEIKSISNSLHRQLHSFFKLRVIRNKIIIPNAPSS